MPSLLSSSSHYDFEKLTSPDMPADGGMPKPQAKNVVMASHGRGPWYTPDGKNVAAYVVGIAGGSASGKTSVAQAIVRALNHIPTVLILSQDAFYKAHTPEEVELAFNNDLDFDHPNSLDLELFAKCIDDLKNGRSTEIPVYSFAHHQRMPEKKYLYGASVIIVEGIMTMQSPEMRDLYDLKVFVNCDSDLMLARRIRRDTTERGRDVLGIIDQYLRFVKSSYDNFVQPSSKYADIIVPGYHNDTAVDLIVTHVKRQLDTRTMRFRRELGLLEELKPVCEGHEHEQIVLLPQTNQLLGILTILRDASTARSDFIFYADRLSTLIVEKALEFMPTSSQEVITGNGVPFTGVANCDKDIVGVSILRSGGPFSYGLRRVIRDVALGALLIQSDPHSGEPLLLNCTLPASLRSQESAARTQVLLLDSQMGTGAAALMAVRVLLDHGVLESNITFLAFLISRPAVHTLRRAFPGVRIVTAALDPEIREVRFPLLPGASGDAVGDAEYGSRLVARADTADDIRDEGLAPELAREREQEHEKVAWVVMPGMGHIGDRYYLS